ncbi:MAG: hypothetical protein NTY48_05150 [Candidatus Diapherotrites archaeon]|nr:hypothetical protein [Candidatus Diapherotrites archaeon]
MTIIIRDKVNAIWEVLVDFYNLKTTLVPVLRVNTKGKFGTRDKSICGKEIIIEYCPKKLKLEFNSLKLNKNEFDTFETYALTESLSMGAQKLLFFQSCNKKCTTCRGFNSKPQFKLLNYVLTYYAADKVILDLFGKKQYGLNTILNKIDNNSCELIIQLLDKIYLIKNSKKIILAFSRQGNKTYNDLLELITTSDLIKPTK